jgi:hypothetical protein
MVLAHLSSLDPKLDAFSFRAGRYQTYRVGPFVQDFGHAGHRPAAFITGAEFARCFTG